MHADSVYDELGLVEKASNKLKKLTQRNTKKQ
jgi:hypothetical protein